MEQPQAPPSPKMARPPLRRGQIRNRIIRDFFRSLAALTRSSWSNGGGGSGRTTPPSSTTTPASSSAYNSEGTSDS